MTTIAPIQIGGRTVFVEIEPAENPALSPPSDGRSLPEGAEETGFSDKLNDAHQMIRDTIEGVSETVMQALETIAPSECSVEIGMAFKGENRPIPILVKVGGEASIKVTATWKRGKAES